MPYLSLGVFPTVKTSLKSVAMRNTHTIDDWSYRVLFIFWNTVGTFTKTKSRL